jgi:hypothetical protein
VHGEIETGFSRRHPEQSKDDQDCGRQQANGIKGSDWKTRWLRRPSVSRDAAVRNPCEEHTAVNLLRERAGQFQQPTLLFLDPLDIPPSDTVRPLLGGSAHLATRSSPGRADNSTCGQLRRSHTPRRRCTRWRSLQQSQHSVRCGPRPQMGRAKLVNLQLPTPWSISPAVDSVPPRLEGRRKR